MNISQSVFAIGRISTSGIQILGTGFTVGVKEVVTAMHVVGANDADLALIYSGAESIQSYQDTSNTEVKYWRVKMKAADPIHDLCVLETLDDGNTFREWFDVDSTDSSMVGATVVSMGFPHANYGRLVLTQHTSQVGARVLIKSHDQLAKHIILNTQAREGQSGGPVINETNKVVAILVGSYAPNGGGGISIGGIDPATLHQTTHAVSAEYLKGMIG